MRAWINLCESVPQEVIEQYSNGDCMWLAVAMSKRFGWPIKCQMERDAQHGDYVAHAYCVMPDGREIDILGPQEMVDIWTTDVEDWDADKLLSTMSHNPNEVETKLKQANAAIDRWIMPALAEPLTESAQPTSMIDVAKYFLETRDDLLDPDEDFDELDAETAEEIVRREYVSGTCAAYAVALHDQTGYPIVEINGQLHVAVRAPDGEIIDYMGKNPLKKVLRRYGFGPKTQVVEISREQAVENVRMAGLDDFDYDSDPWDEINIAKWVLQHRS